MVKRPTPEEFLEIAHQEDRLEKRGKLKIFLGAVPGVGKTYTMLEEALKKKKEGKDIVVGIAETHRRQETEDLLKPLEVLPRARIKYRSKTFNEFNLDKALHRKPFIILVDELAHTNAPGSRHLKRWQDIQELLDQGIHVYTTLNVQHIESLNDIIAQITHVKVQETVPDSIIEMADKIELVDIPPDDLLDRLRQGKVYVEDQAELAEKHFFRKENVIALRELVLRVTADLIDTEVTLYRKGQAIKTIWPTSERLMVCVGPELESVKLIRSAKRLSSHLKAEWIAVLVETERLRKNPEARATALKTLQLAETLGAETRILSGSDLVKEIISFAREQNVSKIIIGKHIRPQWKHFLFKSLSDEVVRHSQEIDVYIITQGSRKTSTLNTQPSKSFRINWISYLIALITVNLCTCVNFFFHDVVFKGKLDSGPLIMIYLLGVIGIAARGERGPAILISCLSVISIDLFFILPRFTLDLSDMQYIVVLVIMLWVAQIISHFAVLTKKQADTARSQERRTAALYNLSKQLANTRGINNLLRVATRYLEKIFQSHVSTLLPDARKRLRIISTSSITLGDKEQGIAQWVYELGQKAGIGTDTLSDSRAIYLPLKGAEKTVGVLRIQPKNPQLFFMPDQLHLLEALINQIALAIEVERLQEEVTE